MPGKCRPSLRAKTLENVKRCNLSQTDKDCIQAVFERFIPKKVVEKPFVEDVDLNYCPCCDVRFIQWGMKHCGKCGQALDWSDIE